MQRLIASAGSALLLFAAHPFAAAQTIKPGLWQIDNKLGSDNAQTDQALAGLLKQMGNLPPEQRKMVEQLAAQQGLTMPTIGNDGAISATSCITPEMAARKQIPTGQQGNCTSNNVAVSDGWKMSFSCSNPASSGEGKLSFSSDSAFSMVMLVNTSARGAPEKMKITSSGRWLASRCPAK